MNELNKMSRSCHITMKPRLYFIFYQTGLFLPACLYLPDPKCLPRSQGLVTRFHTCQSVYLSCRECFSSTQRKQYSIMGMGQWSIPKDWRNGNSKTSHWHEAVYFQGNCFVNTVLKQPEKSWQNRHRKCSAFGFENRCSRLNVWEALFPFCWGKVL